MHEIHITYGRKCLIQASEGTFVVLRRPRERKYWKKKQKKKIYSLIQGSTMKQIIIIITRYYCSAFVNMTGNWLSHCLTLLWCSLSKSKESLVSMFSPSTLRLWYPVYFLWFTNCLIYKVLKLLYCPIFYNFKKLFDI